MWILDKSKFEADGKTVESLVPGHWYRMYPEYSGNAPASSMLDFIDGENYHFIYADGNTAIFTKLEIKEFIKAGHVHSIRIEDILDDVADQLREKVHGKPPLGEFPCEKCGKPINRITGTAVGMGSDVCQECEE